MIKENQILKSIVIATIIFMFCLSAGVYARSGLKFIGNEQETEKMSAVENVTPESVRKVKLEVLISDPSVNIRWNVAKMLVEIGDSQSLKLLQTQITRETDRLTKDQQIQAVYAIKFRLAVLSGLNPESELLGFFYSGYYPLRSGTPSGEPYGGTVYVINQLASIGSSSVRSYISQILDLSKTKDLGVLAESCNKALYILNNYRIPQKYVVAVRTGDLGLRYWAAKELAKRSKTEHLTADNKTIVDLLKAQLLFAENNRLEVYYDNYYDYIKNILKNTFGENADYIEPFDIYENQPPTITAIADKTIYEKEALTITITADDPDAVLPRVKPFIKVEPLPKGAVLKGNVLTWTPSFGQAGSYRITVYAQDELDSISSIKFTINVLSEPSKSIIKNIGATPITGYLLMKVQKLVGTSWQDYRLVAIDGSLRTIQPGEEIDLKTIWNSQNYIAKETGKFRIYAGLFDEQGNSMIVDNWEFSVFGTTPSPSPSPSPSLSPSPTAKR